MLVSELMTTPARTCHTNTALGEAARMMLDGNCGCLPVIDIHDRVIGIITDRDICVAVASRLRSAWQITVRDAMAPRVITCAPDDEIDVALGLMKEHRVRRLPVIDENGRLQGVISVDDVVRNTGYARGRLPADPVIDMLRHVCSSKANNNDFDAFVGP